jgi:4-diphosphocytidyl-2-C-methyl-D-erythritol kinase
LKTFRRGRRSSTDPPRNMSGKLSVRCFAKFNTQLYVLGRRPDGFHEIRTVFQSIDLHDVLHIELGGRGIEFECDSQEVPRGRENLVVSAAEAFAAGYGKELSVRFRLEKRTPVAAGMGGGSSDAAGALRGLNMLLEEPFPKGALWEMAARLGSDVPYFLVGGRALGEGRGEKITPLDDPPRMHLLLLAPGIKISSGTAYRLFNLTCSPSISDSTGAFSAGDGMPFLPWRNELEKGVFGAHPEVGGLKERLLASGAVEAVMCGSGSTVVGRFADREAARRAADRLPADRITVTLCSSIERSRFLRLFKCGDDDTARR